MKETKICKGILHSEGIELPIENFPTVFNKNRPNAKRYILHTCKKCTYYVKNRKANSIKARKIYQKTHHKQFCEYTRKYQTLNKEAVKLADNQRKKIYSDLITDYYVKAQLRFMKILNPSKEIIDVKRLQLTLKRELNKKAS